MINRYKIKSNNYLRYIMLISNVIFKKLLEMSYVNGVTDQSELERASM